MGNGGMGNGECFPQRRLVRQELSDLSPQASKGMAATVPIPHSAFPTPHSPLRILGIDPGLNITGYAILEAAPGGPKVTEAGVVRGSSKDSLARRLAEIHAGVAEVIANFRP